MAVKCPLLAESVSTDCNSGTTAFAATETSTDTQGTSLSPLFSGLHMHAVICCPDYDVYQRQ
jgi:hypothetical protein